MLTYSENACVQNSLRHPDPGLPPPFTGPSESIALPSFLNPDIKSKSQGAILDSDALSQPSHLPLPWFTLLVF